MSLPLAKEELPQGLQRFGDPAAPEPARMMAAKGLVPVKGDDLVTLLVNLAADPAAKVADAARSTLEGLPENVLAAACRAPLHPEILAGLVPYAEKRREWLGDLAANRATSDATVTRIARSADEQTCERIAVDQARLLGAPEIIEALYKNRNTRMSTVDRLVELAARNGVTLSGVATFDAHVEAIRGQLIPEPTEEALPGDQIFTEALGYDDDDDAIETDQVDGTEEIKESHRPLATRIQDMTVQEKIRMTLVGNASARALLVRDTLRIVSMAAISSPAMTDAEAARIAASKQVSEDILRFVGNKRDWLGNYEVKRNLVFNSKTPIGVSMKFLSHLRLHDLKALARSKNIPAALRTSAQQRIQKRN